MGLGFLPRWSNCAGTAVNSLLPGKVITAFVLLVRITNSSKQSIIRVIGIKLTGGDSPGQDKRGRKNVILHPYDINMLSVT